MGSPCAGSPSSLSFIHPPRARAPPERAAQAIRRPTSTLFHDVSYIGGRLRSLGWSGLGLSRIRLDVLGVEPRPGAVADRPGEPGVEEGDEALTVAGGVLLYPDRVPVRGHEPSDKPRVRVELHQVPQDRLVGADRV